MIGDAFPQVLADAQAGDQHAIEIIYRDVAPLVLGYLRSTGAFEPEDIASEVFVSMMRNLESFSGDETHFRSWLLTIAHRRLTDAIRKSGRRREDPTPLDELGERVIALSDSESEAMMRLRARGVMDALNELTEDQRSVLMLRILSDLTVPEISAIVGKPQSAVKALLRRGLASLSRLMGEAETKGELGR